MISKGKQHSMTQRYTGKFLPQTFIKIIIITLPSHDQLL